MNVLVVPENHRNDQYILKPLFERLFKAMDKRNAHIRVCQKPVLGGVNEALKSERIAAIVDLYSEMMDIFILCIDRDGNQRRRERLDQIESKFEEDQTFFAENAWEDLGERARRRRRPRRRTQVVGRKGRAPHCQDSPAMLRGLRFVGPEA